LCHPQSRKQVCKCLWSKITSIDIEPTIVACADKIMCATIDTYFAPNKTIGELHELVKSGSAFDPLKEQTGRTSRCLRGKAKRVTAEVYRGWDWRRAG
jgi:hypothetical protein